MTNVSHTPLPWRVVKRTTPGQFVTETHIVGRYDDHVALIGPCEIEANAQLIVRAVNAHADLLAALEAFAGVENFRGWHDKYEAAIDLARAAIAKAKGEPQ